MYGLSRARTRHPLFPKLGIDNRNNRGYGGEAIEGRVGYFKLKHTLHRFLSLTIVNA